MLLYVKVQKSDDIVDRCYMFFNCTKITMLVLPKSARCPSSCCHSRFSVSLCWMRGGGGWLKRTSMLLSMRGPARLVGFISSFLLLMTTDCIIFTFKSNRIVWLSLTLWYRQKTVLYYFFSIMDRANTFLDCARFIQKILSGV